MRTSHATANKSGANTIGTATEDQKAPPTPSPSTTFAPIAPTRHKAPTDSRTEGLATRRQRTTPTAASPKVSGANAKAVSAHVGSVPAACDTKPSTHAATNAVRSGHRHCPTARSRPPYAPFSQSRKAAMAVRRSSSVRKSIRRPRRAFAPGSPLK